MLRKRLFSVVVSLGLMNGAVLTAHAAANQSTAFKISYSPIERAVRTVQNEKDKIFINLMDVGRRCVERNDICRYYYRGYYYETPWWTAPEIY
jgi:hypothetical protein